MEEQIFVFCPRALIMFEYSQFDILNKRSV